MKVSPAKGQTHVESSNVRQCFGIFTKLQNHSFKRELWILNEGIVSRSPDFLICFWLYGHRHTIFSSFKWPPTFQAYTFLYFLLFSLKIQYHFNLVQMSSFRQYFIHFGEAFLCSYFRRKRNICDVWRQADTIATLIRFYERPSSTLFSTHSSRHTWIWARKETILSVLLNRLCLVALSENVSMPFIWLPFIWLVLYYYNVIFLLTCWDFLIK